MNKKRNFTFLLIGHLLLLGFSSLYAQVPHIDLSQYDKIDPTHEVEWLDLKHTSATGDYDSMAQDTMGFLWIASGEGLHVFDGPKTITYNGPDSKYPIDTTFTDWACKFIHYSSESHLLYLTLTNEKAVISIDPYTRKIENIIYDSDEHSDSASCIAEIKDQGIVFAKRIHPDYFVVLQKP